MSKVISSLPGSTGILSRTSQLTNDGESGVSTYVELDDISTVATTGDYNNLINVPINFTPKVHTHDISDISGTKSEFNTSLTDGDFLFVGDVLDTPDATVTTKGILKLTGDLGGTADNPTTPTAIHKIGDEIKHGILTLSNGLKIVGNTTSTTATKVNVQENDGTINTISKSDLVNVVEVNDVPSLPLVGEVGKIYVVKNVNKIYRWNGTFYQELAVTDISGLQAQIDLKANNSDVIHKTGDDIISLGTKTFNISQPIVGAQFNISATANGASAVAINNMNNGNAFYVDNKGGTAITVDLKNNSRGILMSDYSGGGQTNELFTALKGSNTVYQLNSEGQVLGKSFVKLSAPTTNILLAGGGDLAQNTAFNKNFGTTVGTVAEGNDSRILNGQTAFGWGNHASAGYALTTGSNINQSSFRTALGLGSNAYTSTAFLPLSGGDINGLLKITRDGYQLGIAGTDQGAVDLYKLGALGHRLFSDTGNFGVYDLENNVTVLSIAKATREATFAGTISASPATTANQVVVKSQLDAFVPSGTVNLTGNQTISGIKTFSNAIIGTTANFSGTVTVPDPINPLNAATKQYVDAAARPYKVYTALLSQTGTNAPVATVLENTLGGTVVWSRVDTGMYLATLTGAFTGNKTVAFFQSGYSNPGAPTMYSSYKDSDNAVRLYSLSTGFYADQILSGQIEIRVYL
jgi:hypothetical protein